MQVTGQTAAQGASVQCMQAIETERSPGLPSLMVTTRRRLMPQGTSCSFLQAVTQALHSMQRPASQRNFIRAIVEPPQAALIWQSVALRMLAALVDVLEPAGEVGGQPGDALANALGDGRLHARDLASLHLRARDEDPGALLDAALGCVRRIDLDEHVLLQFGKPLVGAGLLAAAF